jgi:hypothetical protein
LGPPYLEELLTEYEVKKHVTSMKNNKAVGFDKSGNVKNI